MEQSRRLQHPHHDPERDARESEWLQQLAERGSKARGAWRRLFDAYRPKILRHGRRYGISVAMAEDVVQDVMVTLYDKASQFEPGRPASPWIMRIAANKILGRLELHSHSRTDNASDEDLEVLISPPSQAPSVVPQQVIDACRRRKWREFERERPKAALALQLCHAEGWTLAELAVYLETTEGAAKAFVCVERAKARAALEECEPDA